MRRLVLFAFSVVMVFGGFWLIEALCGTYIFQVFVRRRLAFNAWRLSSVGRFYRPALGIKTGEE
jgi:hypothetical protein